MTGSNESKIKKALRLKFMLVIGTSVLSKMLFSVLHCSIDG